MLITIIGKRGTGKTTLAKNLTQRINPDNLFIYDFLGEYKQYKNKCVSYSFNNTYKVFSDCWNFSKPDKINLLICDEIDLYGYNNKYLEFLYRYGRHKNISTIAVSRRFYNLPLYVRALTEIFYLAKITEERDLNYLKSLAGKSLIEKVKNIENFKFIKLEL